MASNKHETYSVFPGRQHYVVMIPERHPHMFLEGVQSIDSNPNTEDQDYGQYGFTDPVISERAFRNETGTIAINHYGYAQRVLRAMAGQDPETSFLYDKSYNGKVDFWENVYNKTRDRVVQSRYWFDATSSVSHSSTLEGVETYSFDFTASRCLEFENKQVVTQSFVDTAQGQNSFILSSPAAIDPVMNDIRSYNLSGSPTGPATTVGSLRHELCPIQYALRVWVDGDILSEPDAAMILTQSVPLAGSSTPVVVSTLFLKEGLAHAGQIVKVAWLANGDERIEASGVSLAPLMVATSLDLDKSSTPVVFNNVMQVHFNRSIVEDKLAAISPADFTLMFTVGGIDYTWQPSGIQPNPSPTAAGVVNLSGNTLEFTFDPADVVDALTGAAAAGIIWPASTPAVLSYSGTSIVGGDYSSDAYTAGGTTLLTPYVTPHHILNIAGYSPTP